MNVFLSLPREPSTYLDQGTSDGVASGLAHRGMELRSGDAGEESNNGGLGEHVDD